MERMRSTKEERAGRLGETPLFGELPAARRRDLAEVMHLRRFVAGEVLFQQNEAAEGFYILLCGRVRILRFGGGGREQVLHVLAAGETCGEVPVFQGRAYPATAVAEGEVEALYVPGAAFLELGRAEPDLLLDLLAVLSGRLRRFVGLIDDLSLKEVSARLAKYLLDLRVHGRAGGRSAEAETVGLPEAKAVLARRLGTLPETLSRMFRKLRDRGVIEVDGRSVRLLDPDALAALAAGEKL
jgi:CRP/FNR family transcriptional regulator